MKIIKQPLILSVDGDDAWTPLRDLGAETLVAWNKEDVKIGIELVDGLILLGGGDVNPDLYGGPIANTYGISSTRDEMELYAIKRARELGLPIMGICRGSQILNVAQGGSLNNHLPNKTDKGHGHGLFDVMLDPESIVSKGTAMDTFHDSTHLHHQSTNRIGEGLRPVGWTKDGVIEIIESMPNVIPYMIGVQFHPEMDYDYKDSYSEYLFSHFVEEVKAAMPDNVEPRVDREHEYSKHMLNKPKPHSMWDPMPIYSHKRDEWWQEEPTMAELSWLANNTYDDDYYKMVTKFAEEEIGESECEAEGGCCWDTSACRPDMGDCLAAEIKKGKYRQ